MNKKAGFTLVELLIVIVVIAILASITVVAYNGIQSKARDTALRSDLVHASKTMTLWVTENSMAELNHILDSHGRTTAWVAGEGADNELSNSNVTYWSDVEGVPDIKVSPGVTLEIIGRYGGTADAAVSANQRMLENDDLCIVAAVKGGNYNYRPMSAVHAEYDRLLYYDSTFGRVVTIDELASAYDAGRDITCEAHLANWRAATS